MTQLATQPQTQRPPAPAVPLTRRQLRACAAVMLGRETVGETAARFGVSPSAIYKRLHRARAKLAAAGVRLPEAAGAPQGGPRRRRRTIALSQLGTDAAGRERSFDDL